MAVTHLNDCPISIVIPTYNRLTTIKQVIDSYRNQEKVCEIILVDDASTDGTPEFLKNLQCQDSRIIHVRNERNLGAPSSRNIGAQRASGRFVCFGEDDLRFDSEYAERLMACLERTGGSIAAGRILFLLPGETDTEAFQRMASVTIIERIDKRQLAYNASAPATKDIEVPFIHAISMVRKNVFDSIQYDPGFRGNAYREETDFYLRAGKIGHKIFFCPDATCFHLPREVNQLGGQMSNGIWVYKYWSLRNNYRFLRRHYHYLKQNNLVNSGFMTLMASFAMAEIKKIPSFYLRKYTPSIYTALARRLGS